MGSTALKQFQRLEASGTWRPAPDAQLREVVVSIGEATLVLSDPKSEAPLTHWSLPAVERINPGQSPARYSPVAANGDERLETLEIDDPLMIDAISRVQQVIAARRPHPGRLRGRLTVVGLAAMLLAAIIWLPPALRGHAARITPPAERERIGQAVLADVTRATGAPCREPGAEQVLGRLPQRIALPDKTHLVVLRDGMTGALMLPGNIILVDNALIAGQGGPDALAGHLLVARMTAAETDPMQLVMSRTGFMDVLRLLTRGELAPGSLQGFGERLLAAPPSPPGDNVLLAAFREARIPSTPYAETLASGHAAPLALTEADPFRAEPYAPILSERDWVTLQQICVERG